MNLTELLPDIFNQEPYLPMTVYLLGIAETTNDAQLLILRLQLVKALAKGINVKNLQTELDKLADELRHISRLCETLVKIMRLDASQADDFRSQMSTALNEWLKTMSLKLRLDPPTIPSRFNGIKMKRADDGETSNQVQGLKSWIVWGTDSERPRYQAEVTTT